MTRHSEDWTGAARELHRAIRGRRSQVAWSRRLGYRSNVAAEWEGARRFPAAPELMRALERAGVDVAGAMGRFHPGAAEAYAASGVSAWLDALRGSHTRADVARRSGFSRHQVRRWLTGEAMPRTPQVLCLLDALTGRAADWVAELVPIDAVPTLRERHARAHAAKRLAYDHPWTAAVLMAIECGRFDGMASRLGLDPTVVDEAVARLARAGLVRRHRGRWRGVDTLTADVHATEDDMRRLKSHWAEVAADRVATSRGAPADRFSFNLVAVSRDDLERIRELQSHMFREVRQIVAGSASEVPALVAFHLVEL